eukprot:gene10719-3339_t
MDSELKNTVKLNPSRIALEKGKTYKFCACEYGKSRPFCDETCVKNNLGDKSIEYTMTKDQKYMYVCNCLKSKSLPVCDGTHAVYKW